MLRTTNPQRSLWEAILPTEAIGLSTELTMVDRLLDDPVFIQPFRVHFDPIIGRPSIPIDTYLRLMFLKFRNRLGYELLCCEVADSISWQRFCRIPLGGRVPHPTTLVKLTRRVGEPVIAQLNQACFAGRPSASCSAPTSSGSIPPWSAPMWPTRLTWGCWSGRSTSCTARPSGPRRPGVPAAAGSGTAGGRPAAARMRSPGPCDRVSVMPSRSCSRSPGSSPGWPRGNWPTPAGS
jgi:Transposase domain (DUF772)